MAIIKSILLTIVLVYAVSSVPIEDPEKRLIKTTEEGEGEWMTQNQIDELIRQHTNFVDVTGHNFPKVIEVFTKAIPTTPRFQSVVNPLFPNINIPRMQDFIWTFSSYNTRHYLQTTGLQSQKWLLDQAAASLEGSPLDPLLSVTEFHHNWPQSSVVVRITGSDPVLRNEFVILGAHQDSINLQGASVTAPGADDNASGSVTVLETLRVLVNAGFVPKRTVEFHWYAAEEVGLRGSADIARQYSEFGVNVVSMVNFDVPGYYNGVNRIGIYTDNVNAQLTQFMRVLTDEYLDFGWQNRSCGYGCSDHVSWTNYGFPSSFPAEVTFHPQMHSVNDAYSSVSFTQVSEFVKLAISYVVEVAEPAN